MRYSILIFSCLLCVKIGGMDPLPQPQGKEKKQFRRGIISSEGPRQARSETTDERINVGIMPAIEKKSTKENRPLSDQLIRATSNDSIFVNKKQEPKEPKEPKKAVEQEGVGQLNFEPNKRRTSTVTEEGKLAGLVRRTSSSAKDLVKNIPTIVNSKKNSKKVKSDDKKRKKIEKKEKAQLKALFKAVKKSDIAAIQKQLSLVQDPNALLKISHKKTKVITTPLHRTVDLKDLPILFLFLRDHRINSLTENEFKKAPYELFPHEDKIKYPDIYDELQLRKNLDQIVNSLIMSGCIVDSSKEDISILPVGKLNDAIFEVLLRFKSDILPNYTTNKFIAQMTEDRFQKEAQNIKEFFDKKKKDKNAQDAWGNTSVHHAAHLRDPRMLQQLIEDPQVSVLISNNKGKYAHQEILGIQKLSKIVKKEEDDPLRYLLFARQNLELCIQAEIPGLIFINPTPGDLTPAAKLAFVNAVKDKYKEIEEKQGDSDLPQQVQFPKYADENFVFTVITKAQKTNANKIVEDKKENKKKIDKKKNKSKIVEDQKEDEKKIDYSFKKDAEFIKTDGCTVIISSSSSSSSQGSL